MKRGSPYPKCAMAAQRGYRVPWCHWPATSIQEFMWNSKSWPETLPNQNMGTTAAKAAAAMMANTTAVPGTGFTPGTASEDGRSPPESIPAMLREPRRMSNSEGREENLGVETRHCRVSLRGRTMLGTQRAKRFVVPALRRGGATSLRPGY